MESINNFCSYVASFFYTPRLTREEITLQMAKEKAVSELQKKIPITIAQAEELKTKLNTMIEQGHSCIRIVNAPKTVESNICFAFAWCGGLANPEGSGECCKLNPSMKPIADTFYAEHINMIEMNDTSITIKTDPTHKLDYVWCTTQQ